MKFLKIILISFWMVSANSARADFSIIRDAEIEEILTEMARAVFKVAGLRPKSAKIYVVNSDEINAFTIGNGYIFIGSRLASSFSY